MALEKIFSNSFDTAELGINNDLATHFYHNDYEKVKNTIIDIARGLRHRVMNVDDTFNEIYIMMPKGEIIVTLIKMSYNVTSVDFKVTTSYILPFGRGLKMIKIYYDSLNRQLELKKIGGYDE